MKQEICNLKAYKQVNHVFRDRICIGKPLHHLNTEKDKKRFNQLGDRFCRANGIR